MPKLKREMFLRPVRFQHRFGDQDDPWVMPEQYFTAPYPDGIKSVNINGKGSFNGKQHGLYVHTPPQSPVTKGSGGHADISGSRADKADTVAEALPPSTRERRTTGPLAEPVDKVSGKGGKKRG